MLNRRASAKGRKHDFNVCIMHVLHIVGHIGADAVEIKKNDSFYFDVAVNSIKSDLPVWYRIFTSQGALAQYLKKGTLVAVVGIPDYTLFKERVQVNVRSLRIELLSSSKKEE